MSNHKGAARMFDAMPQGPVLLGERGYDAHWFREARPARGTIASIPSRESGRSRSHTMWLYHRRHRVETMFGRLKDWRRIHTRYDRCAHNVMSAIALAAIVSFWINKS